MSKHGPPPGRVAEDVDSDRRRQQNRVGWVASAPAPSQKKPSLASQLNAERGVHAGYQGFGGEGMTELDDDENMFDKNSVHGSLANLGIDYGMAKRIEEAFNDRSDLFGGLVNVDGSWRVQDKHGVNKQSNIGNLGNMSFLWQCVEFAELSKAEENEVFRVLSTKMSEEDFGRLSKRQQQRAQDLSKQTVKDESGPKQRPYVPPPPIPVIRGSLKDK